MDKNGIGTDASMATHVSTICERGYAIVVDAEGQPLGDEGTGADHGGDGTKGGRGGGRSSGARSGGGKGAHDRGGKGSEAGAGGGRFMAATPVGMALVEGLGAVDAKLVRPELRASMEQMVAKIACGEAQKSAVVSEGLSTFKQQFERLKKSMHLFVPHFGELGALSLDREGEGGEDELIRIELLAQAGKQSAAEWKRARDIEERLE
eukprot:964389-Prymnesium_polylepis.1